MQLKSRMTKIDGHLASLTETITVQHDQLVTITKATDSLYEYTHKNYRMLTERLTQLQCKEHQEFEFLTRRNNMKARLYADFESAITAAFSGHYTPILLPPSAIRELMKNNAYLFNNTIYQTDLNFVYQYEYIHPVLPILYGKIGYVLRLPRILAPNQTPLYCIKSNAVVQGNKLYKYTLPPFAVYKNSSLQSVSLLNCHNFICARKDSISLNIRVLKINLNAKSKSSIITQRCYALLSLDY